MIVGYPTEDDLRKRIVDQLSWRGPTDTVVLLWFGYLGGLLEWGLIEPSVYTSLTDLLPDVGNKEQYEIFSGEPISPEHEREIDEFLSKKGIRAPSCPIDP